MIWWQNTFKNINGKEKNIKDKLETESHLQVQIDFLLNFKANIILLVLVIYFVCFFFCTIFYSKF